MSRREDRWWDDYTLLDAWLSGALVGAIVTGSLIIGAQVLAAVLS